jgi:transcriptional regulator with PAS, ATPase and Fis domain
MITKQKLTLIEETILLYGPSGCGKSTLAKWIHDKSKRQQQPFRQVNVASLSESLFESELFGHRKGSFTGANNDKVGFCEIVSEGTLFLDEIGDLNLDMQKKLLMLLEEKIYYPVGSTEKKYFKGKVILATHRDLAELVSQAKFREDLYYRIIGFTYNLTPLATQKNKKQIILDEFTKIASGLGRNDVKLSDEVKNFLEEYQFPGNYRELKQILKYILYIDDKREVNTIPQWLKQVRKIKSENSHDYYLALEDFEKEFFEKKLEVCHGGINRTARLINISKVTLISKIKKYGINIEMFKNAYTN